MTRRALLSVYDRTGLTDFASGLQELGFELVASGGTAAALGEAGLAVTTVESLTGAPEMLGGRVKTLHPRVHGGLLADLGNDEHVADLERLGVEPFQLVVSNLYPFVAEPSIEMIDIGGPAMVRAAAKNHAWVGVVTSTDQYDEVLAELRAGDGTLSDETRGRLAREAFARTSAYDAAVVSWLEGNALLPGHLVLPLERTGDALRYGENPHQRAARYRLVGTTSWWDDMRQHSGVALSYLNFYDTDAAWRLVHDLGDAPTCAIIKHANPCGVAVADTLAEAYARALACDEQSAFGGVVAMNRPIDAATVEEMVAGPQADVVIAPGYADGTVDALIGKRRNTRLLEAPPPEPLTRDVRQLSGGFLVQEPHRFVATRDDWRVVTKVAPTEPQWRDAELAWRLCGHVKSNAIVLVKDGQAVGIGAGQQKRVDSAEIAARKAAGRAEGGACASDAFYPFPDGLEAAAAAGAVVVVQPGGAMRDDELTRRADELGLAMVLTGERHFLH
ncbi:MAG TPA: bifunctional phosphoribosylaminoimidazolecarboxamide formyltransferase/IMP cyclohydrolase [Acidimicrobiia bacterium]|nr:bifunctional phosphoribosylaminoimidazolecarboxamide formyltransferase/IMP cyclohydrolase [Acidimicrobiia bacterium]